MRLGGIGRAIAERLAAQGAMVVAAARGQHAQPTVDAILAKGGKAEAASVDVIDGPVRNRFFTILSPRWDYLRKS